MAKELIYSFVYRAINIHFSSTVPSYRLQNKQLLSILTDQRLFHPYSVCPTLSSLQNSTNGFPCDSSGLDDALKQRKKIENSQKIERG